MNYQLSITVKGKHSGKVTIRYYKVDARNKRLAIEYGKQIFIRHYFGFELISVTASKA